MPGKKHVRMRGVKHTSKKLEDELLERSRTLASDPGILRPQCAGNCRKCVFDKPFKSIDGFRGIRNDPDALMKEANRFGQDDFVKAYAGTISLAAAGSVPLLATARFGPDKISYAIRGNAGADKLIGIQYYTDPKIRIIAYNQVVKKNGLHLYSFGEDLVCSDSPNMPEDYLYDTFWESPYEFPDDSLDCGHQASAVLEIRIKSLGETVRICENCAKEVSTIQYIISRLAANDPMDDVEVYVRHQYHAAGEDGLEKIADQTLKDYMIGKQTDSSIIASVKRAKIGDLKGGNVATYIIGTKNYGSDLDAFLKDVSGDDAVLVTVKKFLTDNQRPLVIKSGKVNEILSALWENDWKAIVATHTDAATAEKIGDQSKNQPLPVLESAYNMFISADVAATLPVFAKMGPIATIADKLAKAAKVGGAEQVMRTYPGISIKDSRSRCVIAAYIIATGSECPIKLGKDEREFTDYLVPFVKTTIGATGEKYRDAINTLLTASSSGERV